MAYKLIRDSKHLLSLPDCCVYVITTVPGLAQMFNIMEHIFIVEKDEFGDTMVFHSEETRKLYYEICDYVDKTGDSYFRQTAYNCRHGVEYDDCWEENRPYAEEIANCRRIVDSWFGDR